jgi:diamine N-acetyltransferase
MNIRKYKSSDLEQCIDLVCKTYATSNRNELSKEALDFFLKRQRNRDLAKQAQEDSVTAFVAEDSTHIVGFGRIMKKRNTKRKGWYHLSRLFVLPTQQGKGIGEKMYLRMENDIRKMNGSRIYVASSLYALPFYEKQGFKKVTGLRSKKGLRYQPMRKIL